MEEKIWLKKTEEKVIKRSKWMPKETAGVLSAIHAG
jgi:hypothetical protein